MDSANNLNRLAATGIVSALITAAAGSVIVLLSQGVELGWLCLLATSALACTALPLLLLGRIEVFEPIWFVLGIVAVGVTAKAFYLIYGPAHQVDFLLLGKRPEDLQFAALMMTLGLLSLSIGYVLGNWRWRLPMPHWHSKDAWDRRRLILVSGTMVCVGLAFFALFIWRLDIHFNTLRDFSSPRFQPIPGATYRGALGYLRWGAMLTEFGFYLAFTHWAFRRKSIFSLSGGLIAFLGIAALAFPVFASTRHVVLMLLIRGIILWILLRGAPKVRYLVLTAITGLILIGSMLALRHGASSWQDLRTDVNANLILGSTVGGRHFLDLTKTALILDAVPEEVGFTHGATLLTWIVAPIPRSLWPEKPAIGAGKTLGPTVFNTPTATGVPPGIVAELYLNLGFPGIFLGMFITGLFLRTLYESFRPYLAAPAMALLYTLLSTRLTLDLMTTQVSGSMAKLLQEAIPLFIALVLCSRKLNESRIARPSDVPLPEVEGDGSSRRVLV